MEIFNSFINLWLEYDLTVNLLSSFGAVYVSILVSYFLTLFLLRFTVFPGTITAKLLKYTKSFLQYFPLILLGVFFLFIFPGSELVEYLFLILYSVIFLLIKDSSPDKIKEEYVISAKSLGMTQDEIIRKVVIKSLQPVIFKSISKLHINLWTMLVALEFFKEGLGLGSVFKMTVDYNDLRGFLFVSLMLVLIIIIGSASIKYIHRKFYFWEP